MGDIFNCGNKGNGHADENVCVNPFQKPLNISKASMLGCREDRISLAETKTEVHVSVNILMATQLNYLKKFVCIELQWNKQFQNSIFTYPHWGGAHLNTLSETWH